MKRNFLSLLTVITIVLISCASVDAYAQKGKVSSALNFVDGGNLEKAKEAIDAAMVHDKTVNWPKTYYAMGRVAQAMWETGDEKQMNAYENQLVFVYENYLKAVELDEKNATEKLVLLQLPALTNNMLSWAGAEFTAKNYDKSLMAFEKILEIQASDLYMGTIDTLVVYNAGLAAYNAEIYDKAHIHFNWCIEAGYGDSSPHLLNYQAYMNTEDLEAAEKELRTAFEAYQKDENVLLTMIQFFITNDKTADAFEYIDLALENQPENSSLHYAKGVLFMKEEKYVDALIWLNNSIELDGESFNSLYNAGVCYYNRASSLFDEANSIMDPTEYNEAVEAAKAVFAETIPYMEKAHELTPEDYDTLVSLKELYYRLQMIDKYDEVVEKIAALEEKM